MRVRAEEAFGLDKVENLADGSLLVKVNYPDNYWTYGMLLSYGPDVQVLEPVQVANKIKKLGEQIYNHYIATDDKIV
ncbi:helix-turn-helix transcriptional regulator [Paenibacillus sp. YAF4_2]|uniref:helix-turn-helix transcriptional regulator n=1 Tax=Paenibacillus sp. YAF4_2 TaxID=3233085 RepID=UPI003F9E72DF